MEIVLFHGWALGPEESLGRLGLELKDAFPQARMRWADFGFWEPAWGEPPEDLAFAAGPRVAVCHSLGFLWLLKHMAGNWDAVVVMGGFARFSQASDFPGGVPLRILRRMREKLGRDPEQVLRDFRMSCGIVGPFPGAPRLERLEQGLAWLEEWDGRTELASLRCPVLALGAPDDAIVSQAMAPFASVAWSDGGGHGLPLTRTSWCASAVISFLRNQNLVG